MEGLERADVACALRRVRAAQPQQASATPQPLAVAAGAPACACASCGRQMEQVLVLRCPDAACDGALASAAACAAGGEAQVFHAMPTRSR